jgi:phosphopantetheine--protein transferase-like protein
MIGIDIVYIPKFQRLLNSSYGSNVIDIIFTHEEILQNSITIGDCQQQIDLKQAASLAGKFAAKEVVIKVLNNSLGLDDLRRIVIYISKDGAPMVKSFIFNNEKMDINISISHDNDYAIAIAQSL